MKRYFLYPAQYFIIDEPCLISTILGSCVGVCVYDRKTKIAGLCHYLLASGPADHSNTPRYGSFAIPHMIQEMISHGAKTINMEAKIFGGGAVVHALKSIGDHQNIGHRNIQAAQEILGFMKVPIVEDKTGGENGRKIYFDTSTFKVDCQVIKSAEYGEKAGVILHKKNVVKVLIVDDSATARNVFTKVLSQSPKIKVIGTATDPYDARNKIVKLKPDVITLDIEMPKMNGVAFLEKLMTHYPLPVVMISSLGAKGAAAQKALALGALEFIHKPSQYDTESLRSMGSIIIEKVIGAANSVVKRPTNTSQAGIQNVQYRKSLSNVKKKSERKTNALNRSTDKRAELICIGGNTGAMNSLTRVLKDLAQDSPPVIVAVSTIAPIHREFIKNESSSWKLKPIVAGDMTTLQPGHVYFAPHGFHIGVTRKDYSLKVVLASSRADYVQKPSIDYLFLSANKCLKGEFIACFLSGFGMDGVKELLEARNSGALTIVENPETASCPYGPTNAIEGGAAEQVAEVHEIATIVMESRNKNVL